MLRKTSRLIWLTLLVLVWGINNAPAARAISVPGELPDRKVVVVDPGHGGHDIGAVGLSGLTEKVVTLSVAQKIKEILLGTYVVHLTRSDDYRVDIERRTALANHYRADIFISIHAGSGFQHRGQGMVVFYDSPGTGRGAMPFRKHNNTWERGEKSLSWDNIQSTHRAKSQVLAKLVHRHLLAKLSLVDRGVREAPCLVLRGADMPAILVEIGHLSYPAEEKELKKPEVIAGAAEAICDAIKEYFNRSTD
ncbi:MAG: N-acetylmuramoyl-L-alanine amidase [Deltaproteobacteria bacterium]|nr:N-acetylmuramoyl-L-alanine amidase [Deltaproteobacteria bacterium]MBW2019716.1 N-acetylmuramoyl-L-alanine amidase [Deltaproteobacteria bacterium]MBW2074517.1 N-acetylmuramoyl-L-alanine amidase [Deltaproteobacteria bacterium]RLB81794.1 MAG: hypothetical protein DRH17_07865 [Deltaproteobacteria bacterium]